MCNTTLFIWFFMKPLLSHDFILIFCYWLFALKDLKTWRKRLLNLMINDFIWTIDFWIKQALQLWMFLILTFILPFHYLINPESWLTGAQTLDRSPVWCRTNRPLAPAATNMSVSGLWEETLLPETVHRDTGRTHWMAG